MGLADRLAAGFGGTACHLAVSIAHQMQREQEEWIAELRAAGVKASHPNDFWANHTPGVIEFVYPQFNDGADVGDLVALGWPAWRGRADHKIVRLVERVGHDVWRFEAAQSQLARR